MRKCKSIQQNNLLSIIKMDKKFTMKLQEWLNTPAEKRDLELGAKYLLQLTNNVVLYKNLTRNLSGHADFIEFRLKRYLQYRLADLTHEQVSEMQKQSDQIVKQHALDSEPTPSHIAPSSPDNSNAREFNAGKRPDHDSLPLEIQALYLENASLLQKMRELHLQLRALSAQESTCPDSDRYPFLKEMIELDKRYHNNWLQYDRYQVAPVNESANEEATAPTSESVSELDGAPVIADSTPNAPSTEKAEADEESAAEETPAPTHEKVSEPSSDSAAADNSTAGSLVDKEAARLEQKNILRKINMAKGRYKKTPTDALKESILSLYKQLTAPADSLTEELKQLGIL